MSSSSDSEDDKGSKVRVSLKLAPSVQDRTLEVPTEPIAVPAEIGRKGLSAVINHLLGRTAARDNENSDSDDDENSGDEDKDKKGLHQQPLNFEFILSGANNNLLRKGIEKEARQHGLSLEQAVAITYFPASNAPELSDDQEELPDWISCLSFNMKFSMLCSGCYDGSLHLYQKSEGGLSKLGNTVVSSGPIKCLDSTIMEDGSLYIATACLDHTLHIHTYTDDNRGLEYYGRCAQDGLSCPISSLDFSSSSSKSILASGDAHGAICIWDIRNGESMTTITEEVTKKARTAKGSQKSKPVKSIQPQISLVSSHSQLVSGLSWGNHNSRGGSSNAATHLTSGSWDHSIKLWDVEKQNCLITLNGSQVVSCLDTSYHSEGVVATGHPDCTIRLWDVRANDSKQSAMPLVSDNIFRPSHKAWVSSVHWSQSNAYHLASTSHDGTIKLWDIRSSVPLHTIRAFAAEEKGMCLAWDDNFAATAPQTTIEAKEAPGYVFAGGTDCKIKQLRL
jgi:ribosome biogenesis protein